MSKKLDIFKPPPRNFELIRRPDESLSDFRVRVADEIKRLNVEILGFYLTDYVALLQYEELPRQV